MTGRRLVARTALAALALLSAPSSPASAHHVGAYVPKDNARAALAAGDGPEVERRLMIFFAALARDLALEADRQLARPDAPAEARIATGKKFLEAIWRYYNLVDFAVATRDNKTSVAVRLAFDEAETYVKPAAGGAAPSDPAGLRPPLQRIARVLSTLIDASSTPPSSSTTPRRNS